jgi:hypothetical protein
MKYQCVSDQDVDVSLKSTFYDIKQLVNFITKYLPNDSYETIESDYNYYTISRIKRELEESKVQVKEELAKL